jgi:hypothetical protein
MWDFLDYWRGVVSLLLFAPLFCYFRIPKTTGPIERAFWVKAHLWILLVMFGVAIVQVYIYEVAIGQGYAFEVACKFLIWALTLSVLVTGVWKGKQLAAQIRAEELQEKPTQS